MSKRDNPETENGKPGSEASSAKPDAGQTSHAAPATGAAKSSAEKAPAKASKPSSAKKKPSAESAPASSAKAASASGSGKSTSSAKPAETASESPVAAPATTGIEAAIAAGESGPEAGSSEEEKKKTSASGTAGGAGSGKVGGDSPAPSTTGAATGPGASAKADTATTTAATTAATTPAEAVAAGRARSAEKAPDRPSGNQPSEAEKTSGGSVFFPALLGGIVAAGLGAVVALYAFPQGLHPANDNSAELSRQIEALNQKMAQLPTGSDAALEARVSDLEAALKTADGQSLADAIAGVQGAVSDLQSKVAGLGSSGGDLSAVEARIQKARDEAAKLQQQAEEAGRAAEASAALSRLQAAFDSGAPLAPALDTLRGLDIDIPAALGDLRDGAPTLAELQHDFPPAARSALQASLAASPSAGTWDRLTQFLQAQTGARSLEPREGSSPDAILSRAEAALDDGDLQAALSDLKQLPQEGQDMISDWQEQAQKRLAAQKAVADLAASLN